MPVSLTPYPSFLGVGLSFPMRLDGTSARPVIARDDQLVKESMDQIINTGMYERPFLVRNGQPFGTRAKNVLFESAQTAIDVLRYDVKRALDLWEPRIIVEQVSADEVAFPDGGSGIISVVSYRYRRTNRPDNFVAPFRLRAS